MAVAGKGRKAVEPETLLMVLGKKASKEPDVFVVSILESAMSKPSKIKSTVQTVPQTSWLS